MTAPAATRCAHASRRRPGKRSAAPRFAQPHDLKSLLKVDYKLGPGNELLLIDVSAGLIGLAFDDDLLDGLDAACAAPPLRCTPRLLDAVWQRFELERGSAPRSAAVVVLDDEMFEQWRDSDLLGLRSQLGRRLGGPPGTPPEDASPSSRSKRSRSGRPRDRARRRRSEPSGMACPTCCWRSPAAWGSSCDPRPTPGCAGSASLSWTNGATASRPPRSCARRPSSAIRSPLACACRRRWCSSLDVTTAGMRRPETLSAWSPARWERALASGWPALAFKIGKMRRANGAGDYPTAYVYPVTDVGRRVAVRSFGRAWRQLAEAGSVPDEGGAVARRDARRLPRPVRPATTLKCGPTRSP